MELNLCAFFGKPKAYILVRVHKIYKTVVGRFIRAEVRVHVAVGKPLRAHIVKMVAGLQFAPIFYQLPIAGFVNFARKIVDSFNGLLLHRVTNPGG
jgi:hypothetical protein